MSPKEQSILKDVVMALLDKGQTVRIDTLMPEQQIPKPHVYPNEMMPFWETVCQKIA